LAQGNNFGIGLVVAADTGNIIEDNIIAGNTNGIFLAPGVQGNTFRQNVATGNSPVQVSLDNSASSGFDIKNLADPGANVFEGNTCLTSVNAPCPSTGPSFTANPNPILVTGGARVGATTLSWMAPGTEVIEIHLGSPDGTLFTRMGSRGSVQTGAWVSDGLTFYLQDVTSGKPLTSDYTLATLVVHLQSGGGSQTGPFHLRGGPRWWVGAVAILLGLSLALFQRKRKLLPWALGGAVLLAGILFTFPQAKAQSQPSTQQTAAVLDRMIAAHKTPQDLAQYVFETHGCKSCHTVGQNGKLGFTSRGQQVAGGFEGCIRLLTDMNLIAQTPENRRSDQQRRKAARFEEFGCTFCHKITPGKVGLTEVGAKLKHMHLGCVDVENLVAGGLAPQQ
jgi:parallel beta-helix repeat protein